MAMKRKMSKRAAAPRSGRVPPPPSATESSVREVLEFTAEREIVFRCGKASITLTCEGKVIVRGTHIVSRSSGVNRIKGAYVELN
jgi:hypothetical protein